MEYNIEAILDSITPEELPFPYSKIAKEIDIKTALKLAQLYQGTTFFFPKLDEVLRNKRNEQIKREFDGYNLRELAIKYNLTDRWIRELVGEAEDENQFGMDNFL